MKNLRISLILLFLITALSSPAQSNTKAIDKKAQEAYNKALAFAQDVKYAEAITYLQEAIGRDGRYVDA